jgi:hypothetical protein
VVLKTILNHEYNTDTGRVFYFDQEYGIDNAILVGEISDHYPVYDEYKTNLVDDDE